MAWLLPVAAGIVIAGGRCVVRDHRAAGYERGVVFRAGRLRPVYGPGIRFLLPAVDRLERVDLRVVTLTIPPREVITRDNVPARVSAVVMFQVVDPANRHYGRGGITRSPPPQIAQTTPALPAGPRRAGHPAGPPGGSQLRSADRHRSRPRWGVRVQVVEIKDVEIPGPCGARWRGRPRPSGTPRQVINAWRTQASRNCGGRRNLSKSPASLQLRYLQTLLELGADQNSTVVFPLPVDILTPFLNAARDNR